MWRSVLFILALVVVVHHGVPVVTHASQGEPAPHCGSAGCPAASGHDMGGMALLCLAILVAVIALAVAVLARVRCRTFFTGAPASLTFMRAHGRAPPAHGPPHPLRSCVLVC